MICEKGKQTPSIQFSICLFKRFSVFLGRNRVLQNTQKNLFFFPEKIDVNRLLWLLNMTTLAA